jgi:regulator of replication initiation timing
MNDDIETLRRYSAYVEVESSEEDAAEYHAALDRLEAELTQQTNRAETLDKHVRTLIEESDQQEAEVESLRQRLTNMRLERNEALEYVERLSRG